MDGTQEFKYSHSNAPGQVIVIPAMHAVIHIFMVLCSPRRKHVKHVCTQAELAVRFDLWWLVSMLLELKISGPVVTSADDSVFVRLLVASKSASLLIAS